MPCQETTLNFLLLMPDTRRENCSAVRLARFLVLMGLFSKLIASKLGKVASNQAKLISFNWLPKKFIFFKVSLLGKDASQSKFSNLLL